MLIIILLDATNMVFCQANVFSAGRSCATELTSILDYIDEQVDIGKQTNVISLDMDKAFDKVDLTLLLEGLK